MSVKHYRDDDYDRDAEESMLAPNFIPPQTPIREAAPPQVPFRAATPPQSPVRQAAQSPVRAATPPRGRGRPPGKKRSSSWITSVSAAFWGKGHASVGTGYTEVGVGSYQGTG